MAFENKTDYYGFATSSGLVLQSSDENKSKQIAEARNEKGDVVKREEYGEIISPSCSYILKSDWSLGTGVKFGEAKTWNTKKLAITNITISTGAGTPPSVQVSGEEVSKDSAQHDCTATLPDTSVKVCHHAQKLFNVPWISTDGCYVTQANYTASVNLTKATQNGDTVAFDISDGKIEATLSIVQSGATDPSITPTTGWTITSPLTKSEPDADFPSWSVTLTKDLPHDSSSNT